MSQNGQTHFKNLAAFDLNQKLKARITENKQMPYFHCDP